MKVMHLEKNSWSGHHCHLLCERIDMRKEAHFIQDFWNKGEWTDSIVYGMLLSDLN